MTGWQPGQEVPGRGMGEEAGAVGDDRDLRDLDLVDAQTVTEVRAALLAREGVDEALQHLSSSYPAFWNALFTETVRRRFGPHGDVRTVTAFTARIARSQAAAGVPFAARQAEALIRIALGELRLVNAIEFEELEYPGTQVRILCALFDEWQPDEGEVDALLAQAETMAAELRERAPEMVPRFERWLAGSEQQGPAAADDSGGCLAPGGDAASQDEGRAGESMEVIPDQDSEDERLVSYNRALARDPDDVRALTGRGLAYNARGRHEEALADFNRAIDLDPGYAPAFAGRGDTCQFMGRYQEAIADYDRAIDLDPGSVAAFAGRGNTCQFMGRYQEAIADYDRAIALDPGDAGTFLGRGLLCNHLDRHEEALADFTRAIELQPDSAWAIANRGTAYRYLNRYEESLTEFDRAIGMQPDAGWMVASRGDTYLAMGRKAQALADYQRAVDLDPSLAQQLTQVMADLRAADSAQQE